METSTIAILISLGTLAYNFCLQLFSGAWKLSGRLASLESMLIEKINKSETDLHNKLDQDNRLIGDSFSALKEHVRVHEIFVRDNFARKDDFLINMNLNREMIKDNFDNMNKRLDRIEKKMDES